VKASDIPDRAIYEVVATKNGCCQIWDLREAIPQFPYKIIQAKCRQMIAHGRLRGCLCGCRGDFRFPWEEFGQHDTWEWGLRIEKYLKSGNRVYGY
jgi:hypothetical protein